MNKQQEHLLQLLKEVDEICRRHNITYYTAGGTVIGAARHKGFIPWDDDVDLYMTRDNFEKFRQAVKTEAPADRKLEFKDDNEKYFATIPRYNEETTTQICRYHLLGSLSGGLLIDILIMDDFPEDEQSRKEYLAKLNVYADLIAIPYTHAQRNIDEYFDLYDRYMGRIRETSRAAVIEELENDLFFVPAEESNYYILRWAALPIILSKKMMGQPVYLDFEDMKVPVPEDWYGYLTQLYGVDWINVPLYEGQETHITVSSMEMPYAIFMRERDRWIKQKEARNLYNKRKRQSIQVQRVRRPIEDSVLKFKSNLLIHSQQARFSDKDIENLYANKEYEAIVGLYNEYIELQTSVLFVGELKHASWTRWNDPKIIPIARRSLELLLLSLMRCGKVRIADKLISVYERGGNKVFISEAVFQLNDKIKRIERLYYLGAYKECLAEFDGSGIEEIARTNNYWWLSHAAIAPTESLARTLETRLVAEPENMELAKAYGDVLYAIGKHKAATELYQTVVERSQNGMFWLDIYDKVGIKRELLNQATPYAVYSIEEKEKLLVNEIVDICERHGIKYIFTRNTAKHLLYNQNFGYRNIVKSIYMDAVNATKFLEIIKNNPREDRKIISWENNSKIRDFKLIYSDTDSVYAKLDRIDEWIGIGIHVDIIVLRNANISKLKDKIILLSEILLNVSSLTDIDMSTIRGKKRKIAYFIISLFFKILKPDIFSRWLYQFIMKNELKTIPEQYFFRKNKHKGIYANYYVSRQHYNDIVKTEIDGKEYAISRADKTFLENNKKYDEDSTSNVPPKESLFLMVRDHITWKEVLAFLDLDEYRRFEWNKYGENSRTLSKTNREVKKMWDIMCRGEDKVRFLVEYLNILRKFSSKEFAYRVDTLETLLEDYDNKVKYYWNKKMTFFVSRELTELYLEYLRDNDRASFASEFEKKAKKERYEMEKDFYEIMMWKGYKVNYYINENVDNLVRIFDQNLREGYLRLDLNENPVGLSQEFITDVLKDVDPEFVSKYPETLPFTELLAEQIGAEVNQICLTNGSAEAIRHIIEAYSRPSGKILCVDPSYAMYRVYAEMYGREFVPVKYNGTDMDMDKFISMITDEIDLVIVLNPNNPMGDVYTYEEMDRIIEKAKMHKATVLIDEAYYYFYPNSFIKYALENDNVFLTRTFSKLFSLAGARLGYAVGKAEGIANIQKMCTPHNVNAFGLKFAQAILEKDGMVEELICTQLAGKAYLVETLRANGYEVSAKEGNFIFVKTKTDAETIKSKLKEEKHILVKTYDGIADFGRCLRVTTGTVDAMQRFIDALIAVDK